MLLVNPLTINAVLMAIMDHIVHCAAFFNRLTDEGYNSMETGTVKWFNNAKGFGFVRPSGGGDDIFVHYSTIQMDGYRTLKAGQKVNYTTTPGPKGLHVSVITPVTEDDDTSA